jgi:TonB family protein
MPGWLRASIGILVLIASIGLHVGFVLMALGVGKLGGHKGNEREKIAIEMREREPPKPKPAEPPKPEVKPEPEKVVVSKLPPAPKIEEPPKEEEEKKPPPRIVGLNFESTVGEGDGDGPAFAVGNTRLGETDKIAVKKEDIPKESPESVNGTAKPSTANQVARRLPIAGVTRVGPKVKSAPDPDRFYPQNLRAQSLEDSIVVIVTISKEGKVTMVRVIKPSIYPEFNEAAKKLAMEIEYEPETINGEAVETTLKYVVKFELKEE